jgi:hypothetical protein
MAKPWTNEEKEYLQDKWGTVSMPGIGNKLGRSVEAIRIKAQKLGLQGHLQAGEHVSFNQLLLALGIDNGSYSVQRLLKAGCPVKMHRVISSSFRVVDISAFWRWAKKNKTMLDFAVFVENALGIEPKWVKEKRREDIRNRMRPNNDPWTPESDNLLRTLLMQYKYTYADLSKRLLRSEGAIKRRICDLGIRQRPLRMEPKLWPADEAEILLDLFEKGYSYERIADELGRTAMQVRGKHERILDPEMSKRAYRNTRQKENKLKLVPELIEVLIKRRNVLAFGEYWQKDVCMHWDDVKGCTVGETNCDSCTSFQRIRPQYCRRCGAAVISRKKIDVCDHCKKNEEGF